MSTSDTIALAAAIFGAVAVLISWRSHEIAKRAHGLARAEYDERTLSVKPYLINGFKRRINDTLFCYFAVSYTNLASAANSISTVQLEIEYLDAHGTVNKVKLPPLPAEQAPSFSKELTPLRVPCRIEGRDTLTGWFVFQIPRSESRGMRIECYRVHAQLANEDIATVRTYFLNELGHPGTNEDKPTS